MKAFKYSMENILDYRRKKEEEEKQEFSKLQNEFDTQKNIIIELKQKLENANGSLFKEKPKEVIELKNTQQYLHFLRGKIEIQNQLILELEGKVEAKRQHLIYAQKDRKIIEKHKEKTFNKFKIEADKFEQDAIDELALYAHMRR